jgi:DNA recombination protein RmuC
MQTTDYVIIALLALGFVLFNTFLVWFVLRRGRERGGRGDEAQAQRMQDGFGFLQKELQDMRQNFDSKIGQSSREINESVKVQLSESSKIVREVTEGLTKLGETNKQVVGFSEQLKNLQQVLQNPKQRGVLGEYYLETVLQNVLPPEGYKIQYTFPSGEIVDAAVFVKEKIVPIDSKFSLENYNRMIETDTQERKVLEKAFINDIKLRIKETSKYIQPQEGTTDFAFMFIPSEGIYYDLLTNKVGTEENLLQRAAREYKVIIVSPTSFLAYLQTVIQGLRAFEVEEKAQDIIKNVTKLSKHINKYEELYGKLGNTLGTAVNHYNAAYKELGKIDKDVLKISGESAEVEVELIDKPKLE